MPSSDLLAHTRHLVISRPRNVTYEKIAEATGLSIAWLKRFGSNKMEFADVEKIETLYKYLGGKMTLEG